jgi:hypothetical protein
MTRRIAPRARERTLRAVRRSILLLFVVLGCRKAHVEVRPDDKQAGPPRVTCKLSQPIATEARVIAGGAMFVCRDALCVATAPTSRTLAVSSCRDLAKVVGPLDSFGEGRRALGDDKLGQCNAAAPAPAALARA